MTGRPGDRDIWLADVLEAWCDLGAQTPHERAHIAETLGFDATVLNERAHRGESTAPDEVRQPDRSADGRSLDRHPVTASGSRARTIPSTIEPEVEGPTANLSAWISQAKPLGREEPAHHAWRPPHVPLLRPGWTRHIISAIAAVHVEEGVLDEKRLIDAVSRLRPVVRMPRRPRRTLRRGIQLLLDRGPAMLPFRSDVQDIVASLRTVVADDQLDAIGFEYTPAQTDTPVLWLRDRRWGIWHPPATGTPILVVSDLGLSRHYGDTRGASIPEWLAFSSRCRAAGCPTAALVPRGESTWPTALRKAFTLIPWDHRTDVARALRLLGDRDRQ